MRSVAVLGSTGSIGMQALDVISRHRDRFRVSVLAAHTSAEALFAQARVFKPDICVLTGGETETPEDLRDIDWLFGENACERALFACDCQDALIAVVGMRGLKSVLAARKKGMRVLLANKEALVAGGQLVTDACGERDLLPVDSEHSAIFQCLRARDGNPYEKIILTASGGPFRTWEKARIDTASRAQALGHPTWRMGEKITVDSASMFNKALEIIEAKWLFGASPSQIEVVIHPQSVVHSMVAFRDGAVLAQLGTPDMRAPILYALAFPERLESGVKPLNLCEYGALTFEKPDFERFPAMKLAYEAIRAGGAAACILNAANEIAANAFLKEQIPFGRIYPVVAETMERLGALPAGTLDHVLCADARARETALSIIG